jgi:hypothetical protein
MPNQKNQILRSDFDKFKASLKELQGSLLGMERNPRTDIVLRSLFPRSIAGKFQDDPMMRSILMVTRVTSDRPFSKLSCVETIELIGELISRPPSQMVLCLGFVRRYFESFSPSASEFFRLVAERLEHLDSYRPTDRDFAIEALQDSFVGFVGSGNNDLPAIGDVIAMAKARLKREGKKEDFSKSSWSDLLKESGLDWLPKKPAGRPKQSLDENQKAVREYKSFCTQFTGGRSRRRYLRASDRWCYQAKRLRASSHYRSVSAQLRIRW